MVSDFYFKCHGYVHHFALARCSYTGLGLSTQGSGRAPYSLVLSVRHLQYGSMGQTRQVQGHCQGRGAPAS